MPSSPRLLTPAAARTAPIVRLADFYLRCKKAYFNTGTPLVDDDTFDAIERVFRERAPDHPYLKVTGAVSIGKTGLPFWMGSQDKVYPSDTKAFDRWRRRVPATVPCVASVKLDGVSAILEITSQTARFLSRGDGTTASDWTPHMAHMDTLRGPVRAVQRQLARSPERTVVLRGEAIMSHAQYDAHRAACKWTSTARNVVSGLLNAKPKPAGDPATLALAWVDVVFYEVVQPTDLTPTEQLRWLHRHGFLTVGASLGAACNASTLPTGFGLKDLEPLFWTYRERSPYATDGVVVTADQRYTRNTSGNPGYSFAFKIQVNDASQTATTTVTKVEWNVSRTGFLKPTIVLEPVRIGGVVVRRATGFHYKFIRDHRVGKGARVQVRRSGDVIPNVVAVVTPAASADLPPVGTYTLSSSGVDAVAGADAGAASIYTADLHTEQVGYFFRVLKVGHMGTKTVERFVSRGYTDPFAVLAVSAEEMATWEGFASKSSAVLAEEMRERARAATALQWVQAGAVFGRGVGERKLRTAATHAPDLFSPTPLSSTQTVALRQALLATDGFQASTVDKLLAGRPAFVALWANVQAYLQSVGAPALREVRRTRRATRATARAPLVGQVFCFTGFRSAELKHAIETLGGEVVGSLTQRVTTLVRDKAGVEGSKVKQARQRGVEVVLREVVARRVGR